MKEALVRAIYQANFTTGSFYIEVDGRDLTVTMDEDGVISVDVGEDLEPFQFKMVQVYI